MLFSGPCACDLQSLNVVLCLQSADETSFVTIIVHPLRCKDTHKPPTQYGSILHLLLSSCVFPLLLHRPLPRAHFFNVLSLYSSPFSHLGYQGGFALQLYIYIHSSFFMLCCPCASKKQCKISWVSIIIHYSAGIKLFFFHN